MRQHQRTTYRKRTREQAQPDSDLFFAADPESGARGPKIRGAYGGCYTSDHRAYLRLPAERVVSYKIEALGAVYDVEHDPAACAPFGLFRVRQGGRSVGAQLSRVEPDDVARLEREGATVHRRRSRMLVYDGQVMGLEKPGHGPDRRK